MVKRFTKNGKSCQDYVEKFEHRMDMLKQNYPNLIKSVKIVYECRFVDFLKGKYSPDFDETFKNTKFSEKQFFYRLVPRDACLPGQKVLLHLSWDKKDFPDENFYYLDLNMAYTYALKKFR